MPPAQGSRAGSASSIINPRFCLSTSVVIFTDMPDSRARVILVASDQMLRELISNAPLKTGCFGKLAFLFGSHTGELS